MQKKSVCKIDSYGDKCWRLNDKLHREKDLPAVECANGDKYWYINGELHRDNGLPAVDEVNGDKCWYVHGKLHRDNDLPAIEAVYDVEFKMHGYKSWHTNGKLNRLGGPAIEWTNGGKEWYINGEQIDCGSQEEFEKIVKFRIFW